MRRPDLRGHQVDEVAVAINDAEPLARCLCSRLGSPIGITFVVLLTPSLPGPELVLVLQNELHLRECWSAEGQEKQGEQQESHQSPTKDLILMDPPHGGLFRPRPGLWSSCQSSLLLRGNLQRCCSGVEVPFQKGGQFLDSELTACHVSLFTEHVEHVVTIPRGAVA